MTKDILIFGRPNNVPHTQKHCGSTIFYKGYMTMGEMYDDLKQFIESSYLKEQVTLKFLDIEGINVDDYPAVKKMMRDGFSLPYVVINDKMYFYGGFSNLEICEAILKFQT